MGTQISQSAGLLDQMVARRELQTQLRRKQDKALAAEVEAGRQSAEALEKELSKETKVAGAREVSSIESMQRESANLNQREKMQLAEQKVIAKERSTESFKRGETNQKDAVLEAYGLDSQKVRAALDRQRRDEIVEDRTVAAEKKIALEEERDIAVNDFKAVSEALIERKNSTRSKVEELAAEQIANAEAEKNDISKTAKVLGLSSDAEVVAYEMKLALKETEAAVKGDNEAKAKLAARAAASSENKLKEILSSRQFEARIRSDDRANARAELNKDVVEVVEFEPQTTLGLVRREEPETTANREENLELVREAKSPDVRIIDPQEIRLSNDQEVEASKALVQEAISRSDSLEKTVQELVQVSKDNVRKVLDDVSLKVASPRLETPQEATQKAIEAARLTVEQPERAVQSQASLSIDTALRVLR
jgi:hypothetical protein